MQNTNEMKMKTIFFGLCRVLFWEERERGVLNILARQFVVMNV